jgi:hypothetical protein
MSLLRAVATFIGYGVLVVTMASAGLIVVLELKDRHRAWRNRKTMEQIERANIEYAVERVIRESQAA